MLKIKREKKRDEKRRNDEYDFRWKGVEGRFPQLIENRRFKT